MRSFIAWFERQFALLYDEWRTITDEVAAVDLYRQVNGSSSVGECVVHSARVVEQTFGGITANLWDDAYEWTLPETLIDHEHLLEYFAEVEATRRRGFQLFKDDSDLVRKIMTPAGESEPASLLLDTLVRARLYIAQAREALRQMPFEPPQQQIAANQT